MLKIINKVLSVFTRRQEPIKMEVSMSEISDNNKKRSERLILIKSMYATFSAGFMSEEVMKQNLEMMKTYITRNEIESFLKNNPEIVEDTFMKFIETFGLIKEVKVKVAGNGNVTFIDTAEKAKEVGVSDENIPAYIAYVQQMQDIKKKLQAIVPEGVVGISIPKKKHTEKDAVEGNSAEQLN